MKNNKLRVAILFIFIICSWGIAWPINKIGLNYMSPLWYTTSRLIMGTITMMGLVLAIGKFSLPRFQDWPLILIIGILQIGGYMLLANIGMSYLPAGRASLLGYTTPLWIMPIATYFLNEEAGTLRWIGFYLGVIGLFILLSPWEMNWHDINTLIGAGLLLLASFGWAVSMICIRYMHWSKSPLELIPWQLLISIVPILIYAWAKEPPLTVLWTPPLILSLLYTGVLVTGISYWGGVVINKEIPPIVASIGFLTVPIVSLIISALFMHETINGMTTIAILLIICGLTCVVL